jgi:hypothetical protein
MGNALSRTTLLAYIPLKGPKPQLEKISFIAWKRQYVSSEEGAFNRISGGFNERMLLSWES